MGVTVGDGFEAYRAETNEVSFLLEVDRIDSMRGVVDFTIDCRGRRSSYSVMSTNRCFIPLPDGYCAVAISKIFDTRGGVPVVHLRFPDSRAYDFRRFEKVSSCRR